MYVYTSRCRCYYPLICLLWPAAMVYRMDEPFGLFIFDVYVLEVEYCNGVYQSTMKYMAVRCSRQSSWHRVGVLRLRELCHVLFVFALFVVRTRSRAGDIYRGCVHLWRYIRRVSYLHGIATDLNLHREWRCGYLMGCACVAAWFMSNCAKVRFRCTRSMMNVLWWKRARVRQRILMKF